MRQLLTKLGIANEKSLIRAIAFAAAGSGLLFSIIDSRNVPLFVSRCASLPPVSKDVGEGSKSIANAAAMVAPAVVYINVLWKLDGKTTGTSRGSGTIIEPDGTILTCAHLVVDNRGRKLVSGGKVDVILQDGQIFVGTVLNADMHTDIAIVKINSRNALPVAKLGSSSNLRVGDSVVAIGSPLSLPNTITAGIVSCLDRRSSDLGFGGMLRKYIQTDCAVNKGNSGGPLVNLNGEIVGVTVRQIATGLSFAVPSDSVCKIIEHFRKNGRVVRPWLGFKMLDLDEIIIAQLKQKDATFPHVDKGVLVAMVTPGSPADRAGFHLGDVVVEFEEKPVGSISEITKSMEGRVGTPLKVVVKRAKDISVVLTVIPEDTNPDL